MRSLRHLPLLLLPLLVACGGNPAATDPVLRGRVDGLNRDSFLNRYRDIHHSIACARAAIDCVRDSLPDYDDGRLRAYNNLAYGYYMLDMTDEAHACLDSVLHMAGTAGNAEVEQTIAHLIRIRLLQRECRLAESYGLLHDVGDVASLRHLRHRTEGNSYLYDFALMEYYITSLTLNYHYRNDAVASSSGTELTPDTRDRMEQILQRIEGRRSAFRCDYSENLALNYAVAHSYYRLAAVSSDHLPYLQKAFGIIAESQQIIDNPTRYCHYHQANLYQLRAFIGADTSFREDVERLHARCPMLPVEPDTVLALFRMSTEMFFSTPDPYQHLGAVVAAAEYCLRVGDTAEAEAYYTLALNDTSWRDGMAPKFESMLYDGLLRMGYPASKEAYEYWYDRQVALLSFISKNEREDVLLQRRLETSQATNRYYAWAMGVGAAFLLILSMLVFQLRRRTLRLRRETLALQDAKRKDVERIANVETCLSVLRHDINPFLSYLQNKKLSDEMRREVLDQLLRTFDNIKHWTSLSIPNGLQFQVSSFPLDEVFQNVAATCVRLEQEVTLAFMPSALRVRGDRQLVEILLRNLVNNALQHTSAGRVTVSARQYPADPRFVHITVSDTGTGMDADTLENLFRPDKAPSAGGHGFGLILCRYIIKIHDDNTLRGCRIWGESAVGQGSTFHCLLAGDGNNKT